MEGVNQGQKKTGKKGMGKHLCLNGKNKREISKIINTKKRSQSFDSSPLSNNGNSMGGIKRSKTCHDLLGFHLRELANEKEKANKKEEDEKQDGLGEILKGINVDGLSLAALVNEKKEPDLVKGLDDLDLDGPNGTKL